MKMIYLGTAAAEGIPGLFCQCGICRRAAAQGGIDIRRRAGSLLNENILIDMSADLYFSKNMLGLNLGNVRHIVLTHGHADHFYSANLELCMPGFAYYSQPSRLHLYGSSYIDSLYMRYLCNKEVRKLPDYLSFHSVKMFEPFMVENLRFTPLPAEHGCPDSMIYLIEEQGEEWLYANDTGIWGDEVWDFLSNRKLSLVSLDATFGPKEDKHWGHMSFTDNIVIRERMLQMGITNANTRFICNHFSHNAGMLHEEMVEYMRPYGFLIAFDGMTVCSEPR